MKEIIEKANVLIEALPYIKKFSGKTIVIKYGGSAMLSAELKRSVILDVILMKYVGIDPVLVHGGGPEITEVMERMGKKAVFVEGLRVTDEETVEIAEMVLVGKINQEIVALINRYGGKAVGLSGKDGGLISTQRHRPAKGKGPDLGFVGEVKAINPEVVHILKDNGFIPVISPIGVGEEGATYNINADHVAGEMAGALVANKLLLLTDVKGILKDPQDESSLIATLKASEVPKLMEEGIIGGGMIPKVEACIRALKLGVAKTHIIDGRIPHALLLEIFTDKGIGTEIIL